VLRIPRVSASRNYGDCRRIMVYKSDPSAITGRARKQVQVELGKLRPLRPLLEGIRLAELLELLERVECR